MHKNTIKSWFISSSEGTKHLILLLSTTSVVSVNSKEFKILRKYNLGNTKTRSIIYQEVCADIFVSALWAE